MSLQLVESFSEFKEFKNIDRATMMRVLEDVFRTMIRRKYGSDDNFDVIVNTDNGDLEIYRNREIVDMGEVEDPNKEINIEDARQLEDDYEIGEVFVSSGISSNARPISRYLIVVSLSPFTEE